MKKLFLIAVALACTLFSVFADDGHGYVNPTLGGFVIQNSTAIEMTDEVVEIWEDHVKVTFHFTNLTDEPQKVTVGFPVKWEERTGVGSHGEDQSIDDTPELRAKIEDFYKFKSTCNGKALSRKLIANARENPETYEDKCDFWFVTELTFAPKQVIEVIDEYNHGPSGWSDSIGWGGRTWEYVLTTGSSWANVIKSATIIFHSKLKEFCWESYKYPFTIWMLDDMSYYSCSFSYEPKSIVYDKAKDETVITWVLKNIKPEKNWKAGITTSLFRVPLESSDAYDVIVNVLWDELVKIPEYKEVLDRKMMEKSVTTSVNYLEKKLIPKLTAEEFYKDIVVFTYERAFTEFQPKTKVASTYAQFLINSIYALHGYKFKNEKWTNIFSRFSWYKPETSSISEKDFSVEENVIIKRLQAFR